MTSEELEKARFLFELSSKSFDRVTEASRNIDQRINSMLALTLTLTPVLFGLFYYLFTGDDVA
jgi:hypothetical protein